MLARRKHEMSLIQRILHDAPRKALDMLTGATWTKWSRVIMAEEERKWLRELEPSRFDALEISGTAWSDFGFKSYKTTHYPDYDVCEGALSDQTFDLVIADQVFEHLLWPYRAGRNIYKMVRPGGYVLLSVPFLVRIHDKVDCTRWTETGLKHFLAECGFPLDEVKTGSWGNRACVKANFNDWARYRKRIHSLRNEPRFPYVVWALARKPAD